MKTKITHLFIYLLLVLAALAAIWLLYFRSSWPQAPTTNVNDAPMMLDEQTPSAVVPEMPEGFTPPDVPSETDVFVDPMEIEQLDAMIANPASTYCVEQGGNLQIKTRGDGGEFGLCYFEDNSACEEWALMQGNCPVGGLSTIGYDTEAQKYCAWLGGQVLAETDAVCTLPDGRRCLAADLYQGYDCPVVAPRS